VTEPEEQRRVCDDCGVAKPLPAFEHSDGSIDDTCFRCRALTQQVVTPHSFSTKTPSKARPAKPKNSWERGIARDSRGMPYLHPDLSPVGIKEATSTHRHLIEEHERRKASTAAPAAPTS